VAAFIRAVPYRKNIDARIAEFLCISREHARDVRLGKRWQIPDEPDYVEHFIEVAVARVDIEDTELTYAMVVDEDHSHVTGGVVTHNTGRISSRKGIEEVEETYTLKSGAERTRVRKVKVGANLQNIPSRKEKDPDGIRGAFIAPKTGQVTSWGDVAKEDCTLIVCDFSGFELCMAIHWSSSLVDNSPMLALMHKYGSPSSVHANTAIKLYANRKNSFS
jgi:hypothetical protein